MKPKKLSVFEYDKLKVDSQYGDIQFTETMRQSLELFHASSEIEYFKLIHKGVQFCEYVGVIQVDGIQIEILPKLDRSGGDENAWRDRLIGMLREVGMFRVSAPSSGMLTLRSNSILELYFEIFITEVEYLIRTGLIKQYRKQAMNRTALKGALDFPQHITKNLVHKERFFTKASVYDHDHIWHWILGQTVSLIAKISQNSQIRNRIGALQLNFPELPLHRITEQSFNKLVYSRKTEGYRTAIDIAKLLLLNYHPDIKSGRNNVLALMFDMNVLWESFVYHSLRKQFLQHNSAYSIRAQYSKDFWSSQTHRRYLKPDIVIKRNADSRNYVLDTKWKNVSGTGPSPSDLQQLFAYSQFFRSAQNALLYPGCETRTQNGTYAIESDWAADLSCSVIQMGLDSKFKEWQLRIYEAITEWMEGATSVRIRSG